MALRADLPVPPRILGSELFDVRIPLIAPYRSAGTELDRRRIFVVRLATEAGEGWGECGPIPGYSLDTAADTWSSLERGLPGLTGLRVSPTAIWSEAAESTTPSARHALETAAWDALGRAAGRSVTHLLGAATGPVPVGAVADLAADPGRLQRLAAAGYARIKLKVDGRDDLDRLAALRDSLPHLRLAADANGSLPSEGIDELAHRLDRLELEFVEQPFPAERIVETASLQAAMRTPLCLDESIVDARSAERVIRAGAARMVVLKPARLGGLTAALAARSAACTAGGSTWVGGMLESGIGRSASLALARSGGPQIPADLSPPTGYLQHDLLSSPLRLEPDGVHLPAGPGLGVTVDRAALERFTASRRRFGSF